MKINKSKNGNIDIALSANESLVFFEWLSRFNSENEYDGYEHSSEEQILFNFEACLETQLTEPFQDNYSDLVIAARKEVSPDS